MADEALAEVVVAEVALPAGVAVLPAAEQEPAAQVVEAREREQSALPFSAVASIGEAATWLNQSPRLQFE